MKEVVHVDRSGRTDKLMDIRFRTESFSGSEIRKVEDVVEFEIVELENVDIPDTLMRNFPYSDLAEHWEEIKDKPREIYKYSIRVIQKEYPGYKYAIWLTDYDTCESDYSDEEDSSDIEAYDVYDSEAVEGIRPYISAVKGVSDILFLYKKAPEPVQNWELVEDINEYWNVGGKK